VNGAGRPRRRFKSPGLSPGPGRRIQEPGAAPGFMNTVNTVHLPAGQNSAEHRRNPGFTAGLKSRGGGFGPMRRKGVGETRGRGGRFKRQRGAAYSRAAYSRPYSRGGRRGLFIQGVYSRAIFKSHGAGARGRAGARVRCRCRGAAGFTVSFKSYGVAAKGAKKGFTRLFMSYAAELRC